MKKTFAIIILSLILSFQVNAEIYTWSKYNLSFIVPPGGMVTYSTNTRFEIMWDDLAVITNLYRTDKTATEQTYINNLERTANEYNIFERQHGKIKVKGYKGYSLDGTLPDGSHALICNLVSQKKGYVINVMVVYLLGNRETAVDIIKSFTEGKLKVEPKKQKIQSEKEAIEQDTKQREEEKKQKKLKDYKIYDI